MQNPADTPAIMSLLGVPWLADGRTRAGADCYGLVVLAYAEVGLDMPDYKRGFVHYRGTFELLRMPTTLKPWDILLMPDPLTGLTGHVALMVDDFDVLHSYKDAGGAVREPIRKYGSRWIIAVARPKTVKT